MLGLISLTLALVVLTGCGDGGAKDSISGTVTMKDGQPVSGSVIFTSGGKEYSGGLLDGKYKVESVPKGEYDVLVKGVGGAVGPAPPGNVPKDKDMSMVTPGQKTSGSPPFKYSRAGSLPKLTVTGGKQTHNVVLDP